MRTYALKFNITSTEFKNVASSSICTWTLSINGASVTLGLQLDNIDFVKEVYSPCSVKALLSVAKGKGAFPNHDEVLALVKLLYTLPIDILINGTSVGKDFFLFQAHPTISFATASRDASTCHVELLIFSRDKLLTIDRYSKCYLGSKLGQDIVLPTLAASGLLGKYKVSFSNKLDRYQNICYHLDNQPAEFIMPYLVQYNESFYDFLARTANRCGELLYFENGELKLGVDIPLDEKTHEPLFKTFSSLSDILSIEYPNIQPNNLSPDVSNFYYDYTRPFGDVAPAPSLSLSESLLEFPSKQDSEGRLVSISLHNANGCKPSFSCTDGWLSCRFVNDDEASLLLITVSENDTGAMRQSAIVVSLSGSPACSASLVVSQFADLVASPSLLFFASKDSVPRRVSVSGAQPKLLNPISSDSWVKVSPDADAFVLSVEENKGPSRSTVVSFQSKDNSVLAFVTIQQDAHPVLKDLSDDVKPNANVSSNDKPFVDEDSFDEYFEILKSQPIPFSSEIKVSPILAAVMGNMPHNVEAGYYGASSAIVHAAVSVGIVFLSEFLVNWYFDNDWVKDNVFASRSSNSPHFSDSEQCKSSPSRLPTITDYTLRQFATYVPKEDLVQGCNHFFADAFDTLRTLSRRTLSDLVRITLQPSSALPPAVGDLFDIDGSNQKYVVVKVHGSLVKSGKVAVEGLSFDALPVVNGAVIAPPSPCARRPIVSAQPAFVVDNQDPTSMGRVRLRYPWQPTSDKGSPWTRVAAPKAGPKGCYYVRPAVGEEVMVDYVAGNIERPYVVGSLFNAQNKSPFSHYIDNMILGESGQRIIIDKGVYAKQLLSELLPGANFLPIGMTNKLFEKLIGKTPVLTDLRGSLSLTDGLGIWKITGDSGGRSITIDSKVGKVTINAFTGITISAPLGDVKIVGKNIELSASNNVVINSGTALRRELEEQFAEESAAAHKAANKGEDIPDNNKDDKSSDVVAEVPPSTLAKIGAAFASAGAAISSAAVAVATGAVSGVKQLINAPLATLKAIGGSVGSGVVAGAKAVGSGALAGVKTIAGCIDDKLLEAVDMSLVRTIYDSFCNPKSGSLIIKSYRNMYLETGTGSTFSTSSEQTNYYAGHDDFSRGLDCAIKVARGVFASFGNEYVKQYQQFVDIHMAFVMALETERLNGNENIPENVIGYADKIIHDVFSGADPAYEDFFEGYQQYFDEFVEVLKKCKCYLADTDLVLNVKFDDPSIRRTYVPDVLGLRKNVSSLLLDYFKRLYSDCRTAYKYSEPTNVNKDDFAKLPLKYFRHFCFQLITKHYVGREAPLLSNLSDDVKNKLDQDPTNTLESADWDAFVNSLSWNRVKLKPEGFLDSSKEAVKNVFKQGILKRWSAATSKTEEHFKWTSDEKPGLFISSKKGTTFALNDEGAFASHHFEDVDFKRTMSVTQL